MSFKKYWKNVAIYNAIMKERNELKKIILDKKTENLDFSHWKINSNFSVALLNLNISKQIKCVSSAEKVEMEIHKSKPFSDIWR